MTEQPTVFVVDDDEAVRDSLCWLIRSVGLAVETAESGQEFLDRFDRNRSGCVVLDIRMPGMSGLDLLERLREAEATIPVIMITGHGDVPMAVRALKAGAMDFIEKPFNDQVLLDCVQRAIERDSQQRQQMLRQAAVETRYAELTPREREVMDLVVQGHSNKSVATRLDISVKTVEAHRSRIMEKMEANSVSHLVRLALALDPSSPHHGRDPALG